MTEQDATNSAGNTRDMGVPALPGVSIDLEGVPVLILSSEQMSELSSIEGENQQSGLVKGGILGWKEKSIVYAHPKHLKTMVELWKGYCLATGRDYFGYETTLASVLYIGMEDSLPKLASRINKMKSNFPSTYYFGFTVLPPGRRDLPAIEHIIKDFRPNLIILDPLTSLLKKEDKKEDVEGLLRELDRLIDRYSLSIVIIHHSRKAQGRGDTLQNLRGSSALTGWADTICQIERVNNNRNKIRLSWESRHAEEELEPMVLNFNREQCSFTEEVSSKIPELQEAIRQLIRSNDQKLYVGEVKKQVAEQKECSTRIVEQAIKGMEDIEELIDETDRRKRYLRFRTNQ
jgi:hypothetical protein